MAGAALACSSSSRPNAAAAGADAGPDARATGEFLAELPCSDGIDSVYADPGDVSGAPKGAILKCARGPDIARDDLLAAAAAAYKGGAPGYSGKPFTSGAHVYRVLYRTERGDLANTAGYSSALVLLPDTPRAPRSPVVVASHGSRGQAGRCAPSRFDPAQPNDLDTGFLQQVFPLVGHGYAVIAPDLAGYANYGGAHNPPSAYADAADVGKSTLDGARALRRLLPSHLTEQVVLVGHSQGGHTALSALALADQYGSDGVIAAVAVYAPLWWSQHAWGALFLKPSTYGFAQSSGGLVSIWYHYTHAELLDGPGHGVDLFAPDKQGAVRSFVENDCWSSSYPDLQALGNSANDFFLRSYTDAVSIAATPNASCNGDATCQKWIDRMTADWPHLQKAASVPLLVLYANGDTTITPDLAACVFKRLRDDQTAAKVCYDADPIGHAGIVSAKADYVADWIGAQTLGEPPPADCPLDETALKDSSGAAVPCNPLLPNE
ncbi:MAG: alpha/beta fold hydrolase [Myxococcota bacterium]|nr:alpha/beta fold hydrolase [Myxococcota bacterium]